MNVGEIAVRVKRQFGDESGVQVTDGDIVRWINDGMRDIVNQNEGILGAIATADILANVGEYSLPDDLFILRTLTYRNPSLSGYVKLKYMSFQEMNELIDGWDGATQPAGIPALWTQFASNIQIFPVPVENSPSGLKIYYQRYPVDVTTEFDIPELPIQYHNALVNYCLAQAYELDEDWESASNKAQQIAADVRKNLEREQSKSQDTYETITVLAEDRDDYFLL